uniref:Uncharacterized protein n=1 Tax=Anguilla anguilla TaxID=7936 RepID=A0A0E9TQI8_ANGAN
MQKTPQTPVRTCQEHSSGGRFGCVSDYYLQKQNFNKQNYRGYTAQ